MITSTAGKIPTPLKYYFHSDHLGSSSLITDATGGIVQHLEYIPFGEVFIDERAATSTWSTPYKFNAKELDEETGLYYYGARYYDPRTSVWISVDPLAEITMESYSYCGNNPVNFIDKFGLYKDRDVAVKYSDNHGGSAQDVHHDNQTNDWFVSMNQDGKSVYTSGGSVHREYGPEKRSTSLFPGGTTSALYGANAFVAYRQITQFSNDLNIWRGANGVIYNGLKGSGPNGATGSRAFAKSKAAKFGKLSDFLTTASMYLSYKEYQNALSQNPGPNMKRFLQDRQMRDQAFNAAGISYFNIYSNAASFGYNLGHVIEDLTGANIQLNPYTNDFTPIEETLQQFDKYGLDVYGK